MKKTLAITALTALMVTGGANAAFAYGMPSDEVVVSNQNTAIIMTGASATANSGGNTANGGNTGSAGDGGNVTLADDRNDGGNGGNTGSAGNGGIVLTGDSRAETLVEVTANTNNTTVNGGDDVTVRNQNHAAIFTGAFAAANSGENEANGGNTGSAGDGGNVTLADDMNDGGNGGRTGNAGNGGIVATGEAISLAKTDSDVNRNTTTVTDDCDLCYEPRGGKKPMQYMFWGDDVLINNRNGALVLTGAVSYANTGENEANGGNTGSAGDGGNVTLADDMNDGGNGGRTGNAGDGGAVLTGRAVAWSAVETTVNHNTATVQDDCEYCDMMSDDDVTVRNRNTALVGAMADATSDNGGNEADGGRTGNAGDGGNVTLADDMNDGGAGGNTGSAGDGGLVMTGLSEAYSDVVVVKNREITRIRY